MTKQIILSLLITVFAFQIILGQQLEQTTSNSNQELYESYKKKQKTNKIAAWITVGGGLTMMTVAMGSLSSSVDNENLLAPAILTLVGASSIIVSIPLFIAAGRNKSKARLLLENKAIGWPHNETYHAATFTIPF